MSTPPGAAPTGRPAPPAPIGRRAVLALPVVAALALAGCSGGSADTTVPFPDVPATGLTPRARRVVDILRAQHAAQPPASTYTPVTGEPWCADFVSWVERAAGRPLRNPNSGGWRIPGTMTLLDHLRDTGAWHPAGSGYTPVTGDIAIYDGSPFGQHTNYVLTLADGRVTTCGGNEDGAIRVTRHRLDDDLHLLGHGHRA